MAWIKVESPTPCKPEVLRIAKIMGVTADDAFGKAMRFWLWLDGVSVDGLVDGLAPHDVDAVLNASGFCDALVAVGWLEYDESNERLTVPNFERHNGESAKARALRARRQANWRRNRVDGSVDGRASTREEKRREENKEANASGNSPSARPTPQEFFERWNVFAKGKGLTVARVLNDERRKKIKTRLGREGWWEAFTAAVKKLPVPNDEKFAWQPDLDWFIANDTNAAKVAEGRYDKPSPPGCESMDFSDVPAAQSKPDKLPF